jgi:hypothetical protein
MKYALLVGGAAMLIVSACGDPILPSDFSSVPASTLALNVPAAERPHLALAWLADPESKTSVESVGGLADRQAGQSLIGQSLTYTRTTTLQNDWNIRLGLPVNAVTFDLKVNSHRARVGVAKMVYFDDQKADGQIDWECRGDRCDRIRGISTEFVVFAQTSLPCQRDGQPWPTLQAGYQYVAESGQSLRRLQPYEPVVFVQVDHAPAESTLVSSLRAFTKKLRLLWEAALLEGC